MSKSTEYGTAPAGTKATAEERKILHFQSAVASTQLLASLLLLAEHDEWPGHEERKALLNQLLESYEQMSKDHVNLSVRAIIANAKPEIENANREQEVF